MEKIKIKRDNIIKIVKKDVAEYLVNKGDAEYSHEPKKDMRGIICK